MTRFGLLLRNLRYFRAANLAVVAGMAVATAVLTGALLVGDSVRGSLRELALQRLGRVDFALVGPWFFDQSLADRVIASVGASPEVEIVPAILVRGGASDESGEHSTGGVQIGAVGGNWLPTASGEAVLNDVLADAVAVKAGGSAVLRVPTPGDVPREATLAQRSADEITSQPRLNVVRIEREPGFASMFSLEGGQRRPRSAWMNLADLQREIRQPRRANLLLADVDAGMKVGKLNEHLRGVMRLDDYGLGLSTSESGAERVFSSRSTYIHPAVDQAATRVAERLQIPLRRVSVQLINNVVRLGPAGREEASIHYAVAAGISSLPQGAMAGDEVALNAWAAQRLGAKVGDRVRLDYYQRRADGELQEVRSDRAGVGLTFRVSQIVPMQGLGADRTLTPDYPGLTDRDSIREAPPELGIREDLLSDEDEAYWKQYRAAPKLFVNLETARRLWGDAHGELTSIRVPAEHADAFERELLRELDPADMGMSFRAIRAEQLAAATGSTDFSMLFIGLSFFLIVSAALLVAMLFRLSVDARARQFGVLQAVGFTSGTLYRLTLTEGLLLACIGGGIGIVLGVAYTWLMVTGLRTWWVDAVGTTALRLHVEPMTLAIGIVSGVAVAMLAVAWAARTLRRLEPVRLLSGAVAVDRRGGRPPGIAILLTIIGFFGGGTLLAAGAMGMLSAQAAFFSGAAMLLTGSLAGVAWMLRSGRRRRALEHVMKRWSITALAASTARRHPARSLLTVSLVALASFLLVTVASMRQGPPLDAGEKSSGTGGYRLLLQADIPLLADLNTPQGRERLGMRDPDAATWKRARFTSLRRWAGQDASCLNLTRPNSPTILSVPEELVRQNRFAFAAAIEEVSNPWTLLAQPGGDPDVVPVIADNETARYILKLGIGETLVLTDQSGRTRRLRLVATLAGSMLQSELLMSEANFRRLFPFQSGFGTVLVEADAGDADELSRLLGQELDAFAVTIESTAERLAAYRQVANTYLSTFQTLGSLGLLLGTVGLAVVLLRGLIERRAEFALLSAIGFRPARRTTLVLGENVLLLLVGLLAGTASALAGVLPAVRTAGRTLHLTGLLIALAAVLLTGLAVLTLTAWLGGRTITASELRRE